MANQRPEYDWILSESPTIAQPFNPILLPKIGSLDGAKSRQFQLVRNRAGSASFVIRTKDPMAEAILDQVDLNDVRGTVRKSIRIRRNKVDLWSGPIWGLAVDLAAGTITVNCVGWLETAAKRVLFNNLTNMDYSNGGLGTRSDLIVSGLITVTNNDFPGQPLWFRMGTVTGTMPVRNRYYQWGQYNLNGAIQELSDIEAGFDYEIDPLTRDLNLFAWDSYADRTDIKLGYNWGPKNLKNVTWQEDAAQTCDFMGVQSQGAPVFVNDPDALAQYGVFAEMNSLSSAQQGILQPYGVAELVIRSRPQVVYTLVPSPRMNSDGPSLFDDFQIGEKVYWSAIKDFIKIKGQAIRVFGASVNLDDDGNETVQALQTTPASGTS